MHFDLIKCNARLNFFQRIRGPGGSIIAINRDCGGQETKLTRNESAVLSAVSKAGYSEFSVKNVQELTGLSHNHLYKIFHGYSCRGYSYNGLLEKCPALGCVDTTVSSDEDGYSVRRRENQYSFDYEFYRFWINGGDVWLEEYPEGGGNHDDGDNEDGDNDPGPSGDDGGMAAGLKQPRHDYRHDRKSENGQEFEKEDENTCTCTCTDSTWRGNGGSESIRDSSSSGPGGVCESRLPAINRDRGVSGAPTDSNRECRRNSSPPFFRHAPPSPPSTVKVRPLPGLLDHRDFTRTTKDLGRCGLCNNGKVVFYSKEDRLGICEECFARLMREDLREKGSG